MKTVDIRDRHPNLWRECAVLPLAGLRECIDCDACSWFAADRVRAAGRPGRGEGPVRAGGSDHAAGRQASARLPAGLVTPARTAMRLGRVAHHESRRRPARAGARDEDTPSEERRLERPARPSAATRPAREGGRLADGASLPHRGLRELSPARCGVCRSAGGVVPHLVGVGEGRQSARTAGPAHGLAGGCHQGIVNGFARPFAGRSEVWPGHGVGFASARAAAARGAKPAACGAVAAGSNVKRKRQFHGRKSLFTSRCRCESPIRNGAAAARIDRQTASWPGAARRRRLRQLPICLRCDCQSREAGAR